MRLNRLRPFTHGAIRHYLFSEWHVKKLLKIVGTEAVSGGVVVDISRPSTAGAFNDERYRYQARLGRLKA